MAQNCLLGRTIGNDAFGTLDELWVQPLLGGVPRRLGNLVAQNAAAAWSPDGQQLIYAIHNELHIARSDGTEVRKLATASDAPAFLRWSPDGSKVRFSLPDSKNRLKFSLWEVSVASGELQPLLPGWEPSFSACCGNWTRDGRYFVFEAGTSRNVKHLGSCESNRVFTALLENRCDSRPAPWRHMRRLSARTANACLSMDPRIAVSFSATICNPARLTPELPGVSGTELEYSPDGKWVTYVSFPGRIALEKCR